MPLIDGFSAEAVPEGDEADDETKDDGAEDDDEENDTIWTEATRFDEPAAATPLLRLLDCRLSKACAFELLVTAAVTEDEEDEVDEAV